MFKNVSRFWIILVSLGKKKKKKGGNHFIHDEKFFMFSYATCMSCTHMTRTLAEEELGYFLPV